MFPNELLQVLLICRQHTLNTYLVGGCVRDMQLGKNPKDFDIVVDSSLENITKELRDNDWKIDEAGLNFLVTIASKKWSSI